MMALGLTLAPARAADPAPPVTIPSLDVPRYMGTWYEIAKYPNRFQRDCAGNTTATYSVREDGKVQVVNRCRQKDGTVKSATGVARQLAGPASPKLEVRFAPAILSFLPMVWGDYWIIDLDPGYTLAAVSDAKREYLWILARTPAVDKAALDGLTTRLKSQGFDIGRLEPTPQN